MVDLDEDAVSAPPPGVPNRGRSTGRARRPAGRRPGLGADAAPFLFLLAALTPLAGALFRIIDLVGLEGLTATEALGPRLQILGNAVNPITGLLLLGAVLVSVVLESSRLRIVAGTAVAMASLMLVVALAVTVAAIRDSRIFPRTNDVYIEVISYEVGSALAALGVIWIALRLLRRPTGS